MMFQNPTLKEIIDSFIKKDNSLKEVYDYTFFFKEKDDLISLLKNHGFNNTIIDEGISIENKFKNYINTIKKKEYDLTNTNNSNINNYDINEEINIIFEKLLFLGVSLNYIIFNKKISNGFDNFFFNIHKRIVNYDYLSSIINKEEFLTLNSRSEREEIFSYLSAETLLINQLYNSIKKHHLSLKENIDSSFYYFKKEFSEFLSFFKNPSFIFLSIINNESSLFESTIFNENYYYGFDIDELFISYHLTSLFCFDLKNNLGNWLFDQENLKPAIYYFNNAPNNFFNGLNLLFPIKHKYINDKVDALLVFNPKKDYFLITDFNKINENFSFSFYDFFKNYYLKNK